MEDEKLNIHAVMQRTLTEKEAKYKEVIDWFENEYHSFSDEEKVDDLQLLGAMLKSQINLLQDLIRECF
jgi:hypothetical protein